MSRLAPEHPVSGGLSLGQSQAYNPTVNPLALTPGGAPDPVAASAPAPQAQAEAARADVLGRPVRRSFGSIAANTGIDITTVEQLNPTLPPAKVQPGDRVWLRH